MRNVHYHDNVSYYKQTRLCLDVCVCVLSPPHGDESPYVTLVLGAKHSWTRNSLSCPIHQSVALPEGVHV